MSIKKKLIVLTLGILIVGVVGVLTFKPKDDKEVKKTKEHIVVIDDITIGIEGGGEAKLEGKNQNFLINGIVEEIYVKKGEKINKGDKIAKLSDKEINIELSNLKIDKKSKVDTLNNLREQQKNITDTSSVEYKSLQSEIKIAEGELEKLNNKISKLNSDIDKLYVYSKNKGVVIDIGYEVGTEATISKPVAIIGDESSIYIDVLLPQTEIIDVKENQKIEVTLETYPDTKINGEVEEISYVNSSQGEDVDYLVRSKIDVKDLQVYHGMTGEVTFIIKNKENVLQIPNRAISIKDNKQIVKVKENNKIIELEVKTGFSDGRVTEIIEGLKDGQIVVEER